MMDDGIGLTAIAHPVAPWWRRLWLLRYRRNRLNEQALVDTVIEIKGEPQ